MSPNLTRFLGDTPFRVFIRLLVLSFIVGLVLATLEIHPLEIFPGCSGFSGAFGKWALKRSSAASAISSSAR